MKTIMDPSQRPAAGAILQDHYDLDCPWHRHDMHQLQYTIERSIEVEDSRARYLLPRGLAAWIPAGVVHRTSLHRVRSGSILFDQDLVPDATDHVRIIEVTPLMREMMIATRRWPLDRRQDATCRAYYNALSALCREWIDRDTPLSLPTTLDEKLRGALDFTRNDLSTRIGAVCRAAGLSERTLRRRCRRELGLSWDEYRHRARMLRAAGLLTDTMRPIGAIAAEIGFEGQSSFAAAFRKITGKTPSLFRSESSV